MHINIHRCAHTQYTYLLANTYILTHAHTKRSMHIHTYKNMYTCTHTHIYIYICTGLGGSTDKNVDYLLVGSKSLNNQIETCCSQWGSTIKSPWVHTVTSLYTSWYDLRCWHDAKQQTNKHKVPYIHTYTCECIYIYIYIWMHICTQVYTYSYIYVYISI